MRMPDRVKEFFQKQGKIGGKKRSANLSAERRKEIAKRAAKARWAKKTGDAGRKGNQG